ncbi:hypothetical protein JW796_03545 [Candidatus Dojkabacteria bacterium]|nr:hypothetical protein [Candidatus Dojkabacteria bacterium]
MKNKKLTIIAGPCSIDETNVPEIYEISKLPVAGTRIVGLKSRTALDPKGEGMGIDFEPIMKNLEILWRGGNLNDLLIPPSVEIAEKFHKDTGLIVATEIMLPSIQLPLFEGRIGKGKLMAWNPAVNQLGWQIIEIGSYARKNRWTIGIKNGKWVGEDISKADSTEYDKQTSLEKTWAGLTEYGGRDNDIVLIHRGVDIAEKGSYRNYPVHNISKRVKQSTRTKLFFDPSHIFGSKKRDQIVEGTIDAMKIKEENGAFLYDGILIEVGTSKTDTDQHITIDELKFLTKELRKFRELVH